ncbi:hypothetical protein [Marinifilum caeruleilacunae]|uniref:Uncharacterized protein n=1 Tax=Marinifilum caeruleilacunae TaxID=2499076 RepID=A0ABX1X078_9BACT|nr:hypothetical protein [Marinifilum caeruleilacunae]NOU61797.1 hypothetical protein [Marinifilum caeruleilacunae]
MDEDITDVLNDEVSAKTNEKYLLQFAEILSKATYEREDVREFLKTESIKQFDKNYDVLYLLVKNKEINGNSFRDILVSYSSKEIITEIESNVPLLNILVPEIMMFNIKPENLNIKDNEVPVVVSEEIETSLYLNGEKELSLEKGEVPNFHVFVVNENSRVIVPIDEIGDTKNLNVSSIQFKSPNFDGTKEAIIKTDTKSTMTDFNFVGPRALTAFTHFNRNDGSIYQKAFQRDYLYYGITPTQRSGSLNRSMSEYLSYISINPTTYFKVSDQVDTGSNSDDPYIQNYETTQKSRELSQEELIDRMWTKGAYEFRFEVITSTNQHPQIVYVPLKPYEIWNFNITHEREHSTWFSSSKHIYKINPNNFTAKNIFLQNKISLGKWHLAEESLYRYVNIIEEDESIDKTITMTYESTKVHTNKFNGDLKLDVGIGKGTVTADVTESNTIRENKTVNIIRKEKSDDLGSVRIYFYEPIIETIIGGGPLCVMKTYNTGHVTFGITVE